MKKSDHLQQKLSDLEKFIETVLQKPMNDEVKRNILAQLQDYKAKLISEEKSPKRFRHVRH